MRKGKGGKEAAKAAFGKSKKQQEGQPSSQGVGFLPPGSHNHRPFQRDFDAHFYVPPRVANVHSELICAVNDFHYAMMNDINRNDFYYGMLKAAITPGETTVLEIGTGSGLLSMMAASLGAKWVLAVEGSPELSHLAKANIAKNNLSDKVTVINKMSTALRLSDMPSGQRADILVSELFGTLLLGESALDYIADVRKRNLLAENAKILPRHGRQFAVVIECPSLAIVSTTQPYQGLDLSYVNALCDTSSVVFTKKYGFRLNSVPYTELCAPVEVVKVDFAVDAPGFLPLEQSVRCVATRSGTAHAVMLFWKATDEITNVEISTDPKDTTNNFARDMQWGQALQIIDGEKEGVSAPLPSPFILEEGKSFEMKTRSTSDSVVLQFALSHLV